MGKKDVDMGPLTAAFVKRAVRAKDLDDQARYCDYEVLQAKNAGASWQAIMTATGLSRRGISLALERARQA
ncbi:hypothetical protein [Pseudoclavibacter helvolus]|uniref:hypothetical protein n=1 Tax=Pseudoclavibacter helvolus TaxID=255205 RepID=UPI003C763D7E